MDEAYSKDDDEDGWVWNAVEESEDEGDINAAMVRLLVCMAVMVRIMDAVMVRCIVWWWIVLIVLFVCCVCIQSNVHAWLTKWKWRIWFCALCRVVMILVGGLRCGSRGMQKCMYTVAMFNIRTLVHRSSSSLDEQFIQYIQYLPIFQWVQWSWQLVNRNVRNSKQYGIQLQFTQCVKSRLH